MTLIVSIVLYKNKMEVLKNTIISVLNTNLPLKLFLVDNSPTNLLKSIVNDNRVEYIHNPTNPGFGAAHNLIIRKSIEFKSKFVLNFKMVLNFNDLKFLYWILGMKKFKY